MQADWQPVPGVEGWVRASFPTIMSGEVWRYRRLDRDGEAPSHTSGEVNAGREGVGLVGSWGVLELAELDALEAVLLLARQDHQRLAGRGR